MALLRIQFGSFKFGSKDFNLKYVIDDGQVKFVAKTISKYLVDVDCDQAMLDLVDGQYKCTYEYTRCLNHVNETTTKWQSDPLYLHPSTVLVTKEGACQLIASSKASDAVRLQVWLLEEVIPQILSVHNDCGPTVVDDDTTFDKLCNNKEIGIDEKATTNQYSVAFKFVEDRLDHVEASVCKLDEYIDDIITTKNEQRDEIVRAVVETSNRRVEAAIASKDRQITRVVNDLNRMYNSFRDTLCQKDDLLRHTIQLIENKDVKLKQALEMSKNKEVLLERALESLKNKDAMLQHTVQTVKNKDALLNKAMHVNNILMKRLVDTADCSVEYPSDEVANLYLYVTRRGKTFAATTGQKSHIENCKKRIIGRVLVEAKRPNPQLEWNGIAAWAQRESGAIRRKHKRLSFKSNEAADRFESELLCRFAC
ncbi:BRO [Orgyia pseudotsugata single capsid nuclopolyhedrovirus]|nr:BRO [Orgyia pseudotsugata single capsid nuclopolyhedrovirus]